MILTGCATTEKVVAKTETKYIKVPDSLLTPCPVSKPPVVSEYTNADARKKEDLLVNYSSLLLKDLADCNDTIKSIKSYQETQLEIEKKAKESKDK